MMQRFAIIDIETTGSRHGAHGITEVAILIHNGTEIIDSFETLINPEAAILPFVERLTGITNEMVRTAPRFSEVAKKIWLMTEDAVFVAHSVNFDYTYIRNAYSDLGADYRRKKLCTVRLSRKIFPGLPSYSLGTLCSSLGITAEKRHRAMGDAMATASLFKLCQEHDKENLILSSLKKNSKEAILPPLLPKEDFENLPEKPGVYYFHDSQGKIIYIGKAINIKNRIYSHFTGTANAHLSFVSAIARITFTVCGTELIALLLESHEIKRWFPLYNQAQKYDNGGAVLADYTDERGVHHLLFTKSHKHLQPLIAFRSMEGARRFIADLAREFELCPKYCGLHHSPGPCFDYHLKKCRGICAGEEDIDIYNNRVQQALQSLGGNSGTRLIIDQGRDFDEQSVILIENGIYKGFGYFKAGSDMDTEKAKGVIQPFRHNADVQRILNGMVS